VLTIQTASYTLEHSGLLQVCSQISLLLLPSDARMYEHAWRGFATSSSGTVSLGVTMCSHPLQKASVNFLGVDDWNKKSMIQARIFP
jgi:hypothetical protein